MKTTLALLLALTVTTSADAATRCRTSTVGSTTYTTCETPSGKTECRSSRLDHLHHLQIVP
jgi:hypothetical protein